MANSEKKVTFLGALTDLIRKTGSMDATEKGYWLDLLPSMTDEQSERLYDILETERSKMADLEAKYQHEIKDLNQRHLIEWKAYLARNERRGEK